jgi:hypothetical protein
LEDLPMPFEQYPFVHDNFLEAYKGSAELKNTYDNMDDRALQSQISL